MKILFFLSLLLLTLTNEEIFLSEGKEEEKDQLQVEYMTNVGPDYQSILCYPKDLSQNKKHGIIVWGPGGGSTPGQYEGIIRRLASHGFVVIGISSSPGDASKAIAALNWLEEKNNLSYGPLSGKLDMNVVGCSGHSMGGLESEQAIIKDSRVKTSILNNSGDLAHVAMGYVPNDRPLLLFMEIMEWKGLMLKLIMEM